MIRSMRDTQTMVKGAVTVHVASNPRRAMMRVMSMTIMAINTMFIVLTLLLKYNRCFIDNN